MDLISKNLTVEMKFNFNENMTTLITKIKNYQEYTNLIVRCGLIVVYRLNKFREFYNFFLSFYAGAKHCIKCVGILLHNLTH